MYKSIFFSGVFFLFLSSNLLASDKFIITVHPSAHPFGWHEDGKVKGAIYELIKLIGKDLDIPIEPITLPWARSLDDVKSGTIDMILTLYFTKERSEFLSYSIPYDYMETSVFVKKDKKLTFSKWDDLIGLTGLKIIGDSRGDKWDKFEREKLNVVKLVNIEQIFKMLLHERADYAVFPKISTIREIEKMGYSDKITYLEKPIISQGVYIAISKKSPYHQYLPKINELIKKYTQDGTYERLRDKAFEDISK